MNLKIDIRQSRLIPFVAMALLMTHLVVSFFDMEMFSASYLALAGMLLATMTSVFLLIRHKSIHQFDLIVLLFIGILEGISLLNGTDWKNWLYLAFSISAYIFLFNYYQDKYITLLFGILFILSIAIYCQLFQCILHPEKWMVQESKELNGFLLGGNYNQMGSRFIIALTTGILTAKYNKWLRLNLILLFTCTFAILFMVRSMTALSCIFLFLFFCLIRNQKLLTLGIIVLYIGVFLFQIIVCFSGTGLENIEFASWFVKDVLGKDMTFTGRTIIWDSALRVIADSPIWGYGFVDSDWFRGHMTDLAIGAHNYILNTMVYGGVILIAFYTLIVLKSLQHLIHFNERNARIQMASFGVMSAMMLFEAYGTPLVILLLTIMRYYPGQESLIKKNPDAREQ